MTYIPSQVKTDDARPIVNNAIFRPDFNPYYAGCGDDIANAVRGAGAAFKLNVTGVATTTIDAQFIDAIYLAGGFVKTAGGAEADLVNMFLVAPATVVTLGGDQNCILSPTGLGFNIIVPVPNGVGSHELDLTAPLNANLAAKSGQPSFISAVTPVPAPNGDGFFDYNEITGVITVNASQKGKYNLYDQELILNNWLVNWSLWDLGLGNLVSYDFLVPTNPKRIEPHWILRSVFETTAALNVTKAVWSFYMARSPQ